jgi:hypothetical protein
VRVGASPLAEHAPSKFPTGLTTLLGITRHGKPAGVLNGFESDDDWFEYRLENDPQFSRRIEQARNSLRAGRGITLEDVETK